MATSNDLTVDVVIAGTRVAAPVTANDGGVIMAQVHDTITSKHPITGERMGVRVGLIMTYQDGAKLSRPRLLPAGHPLAQGQLRALLAMDDVRRKKYPAVAQLADRVRAVAAKAGIVVDGFGGGEPSEQDLIAALGGPPAGDE